MLGMARILKQTGRALLMQEVWDTMEFYKGNLPAVKKGERHFTPTQIQALCMTYNVDANYILGITENIFLSDSIPLRKTVPKNVNRKVNSMPQKTIKKKVTRK